MVFEVTLGNVITIVALVVAALWALFKLVSVQQERRLSDRFDGLGRAMADVAASQQANATATAQLEREFHRAQVELARDYVRREDFVRELGSIGTRIDNFALRMERALEKLGGPQ
ncbi:hypothetical protein [Paracidovorax cattleyae]|uniref:hypothetical protein n=1 Tax=Paracidovorax cattleyae TaxID=80868 RepID=UPI0018AFDC10|nr:hypothetical protein [Paracidovorax cattleyae]MBF9263577.1 hypothetical protein [Paracidovorax cattleyae]